MDPRWMKESHQHLFNLWKLSKGCYYYFLFNSLNQKTSAPPTAQICPSLPNLKSDTENMNEMYSIFGKQNLKIQLRSL